MLPQKPHHKEFGDKIVLQWEGYHVNSPIVLVKNKVEFNGSRKHCAQETIRWLWQKGLISAPELFELSLKLDFKLFGRATAMWDDARKTKLAEVENNGLRSGSAIGQDRVQA